ncbi:hypothetical protein LEMLEM_LOCUS5743 [Lemmus lemmus]
MLQAEPAGASGIRGRSSRKGRAGRKIRSGARDPELEAPSFSPYAQTLAISTFPIPYLLLLQDAEPNYCTAACCSICSKNSSPQLASAKNKLSTLRLKRHPGHPTLQGLGTCVCEESHGSTGFLLGNYWALSFSSMEPSKCS